MAEHEGDALENVVAFRINLLGALFDIYDDFKEDESRSDEWDGSADVGECACNVDGRGEHGIFRAVHEVTCGRKGACTRWCGWWYATAMKIAVVVPKAIEVADVAIGQLAHILSIGLVLSLQAWFNALTLGVSKLRAAVSVM